VVLQDIEGTTGIRQALCLPTGGAGGEPRFLAELAETAEAAGWEAVLLEDYIDYQAMDTPTCDPWIALAAMAMSTRRVLLGTAVTPIARRRPWRVAQEVASLDRLSVGRAVLGAGLGDTRDPTFERLGEATDLRTRAAMTDEGLEIIDGLWRGDPLHFKGGHYRVDGVALRLTPLQKPRVPIWIGGLWPRRGPVERAARWDGSMLGWKINDEGKEVDLSPAEVREQVAEIGRLRPQGLDGYDFVMGGRRRKPDEAEELDWIRRMEAAGATWWMEWLPPADAGAMREAVRRGPVGGAAC
jgi:alkanesulfonate monooxygenase SsuD/methylene tetrahydromethanopterin reductase-like flavin-dependent oxidoreductase (luciferase family)